MTKKILILLLILTTNVLIGQQKKFQINGAARGYLFSNKLNIDESLDSVTTRKANYGHTLLDMGISLFPNKNTEVISMFRIRNEIGGFWGGGVSFNVRQLTLKGVAGNKVKYEIGDIDLKMTPYTLFNTIEEGAINEGDVFAMRREIVYYDMFYNEDNSWRMQGAKVNFGLEFANVIEAIKFKGFITRQRPTDGIVEPERLYGGGTINIKQSENLSFGFNSVNIFDLTETIQDSIQYKNNVHTFNLLYKRNLRENISLGIKTETGMSGAQYINYKDARAPESINDYFYDLAFVTDFEDKKITVELGYKDIGADFLSPGAQTKRINYSKFPGLYQQISNNVTGRPISYTDFISGNTENSIKISEELIPYFAGYNNMNPYGDATPNRRGVYLNLVRTDSVKFKNSFVKAAFMTQSRGTGTSKKKKFIQIEAGTDVYINDFFGWKKQLKLDLGLRYENTSRTGEIYEKVKLNSTFIDAGISWEFAEKLDLLVGAKVWVVKGNTYVNLRNQFNAIENFDILDYNFSENTYASGLRYRFNDKNTLSAQYQFFDVKHKDATSVNYGISQFTFLYSLTF
ncbi:MAG: opacity protein-like surface antigen [Urechidicola sp.]|jgi:opacity protein-like surface antigen